MLFYTKVLKSGDNMKRVLNTILNWLHSSQNKILVIEIIMAISLLFNSFVFKIAKPYEISLLLLPFLVISFFLFGYEKTNYRNKKDVILNILIFILIYYFITYVLGLFTGFIRNSYSLLPINIIKNTFPIITVILVSELLRYQIFSKSKGSILCLIIGYIAFVLIDVNMMVHLYDVFNYTGLTKMICLVVFPSITKNIMLIYIARRVGYSSNILYRFLTELTMYTLPIFPDFGEYINILLKTILPIIIVVRINTMFNYFEERRITSSKYNNKRMIAYSVITAMLFIIVTLTSGYFRYQALSIGSGSMEPKIGKGDVVIVKRLKKVEIPNIKKGDVLVHYHDNKIIVHRVVKIIKVKNNLNFITKGDNNNARDAWIIKEKDVVGTVSMKIKYIGMPTVALNELLNR